MDNPSQHIDQYICQLRENFNDIIPMDAYRTGSSVSANQSELFCQRENALRDVDYLLIFSPQEDFLEKRKQIRDKVKDLFSNVLIDKDDVSKDALRIVWPQYENNLIRVSEESVFVYKWEFVHRGLSFDVTMRSSLNFQPPISTVRVLSLGGDQEIGRFSSYPSDQLHVILSRCETDRDWLIAIKKIYLEFLKKGEFFMEEKWSLGERSCLSDTLLASAKLSKGHDSEGILSDVKALNSVFVQSKCSDVWVDNGLTLSCALSYGSDLMRLGQAMRMFDSKIREQACGDQIRKANYGFKCVSK